MLQIPIGQIYNDLGVLIKAEDVPKPLTGSFMRSLWRKGLYHDPSKLGYDMEKFVKRDMSRAQVPYVVTFLNYDSKLQMTPDPVEIYLYAPLDLTVAVTLGQSLWRRWYKFPELRKRGIELNDAMFRDEYPKVEDGAVAEPIDDATFADLWKHTRLKKYGAAGNPDNPFAFTCQDGSVKIYRSSDFQEGLAYTV